MSILNRLIRVTKAAAGEMLTKLEDPVMMLNHYLRDAGEEIESLEQELAKQKAAARSWELRATELQRLAESAEGRAAEALASGRETEARVALEAKLHYVEQAQECAALHETAKTGVAELERQLAEAKEEHARMQAKKAELAARAQRAAAKARVAVNEFSASLEGSAARGFRRMEEKILEWEAKADLASQRYTAGGSSYTGAASHDGSQQPPDAGSAERAAWIEEELRRLREKRGE